MKKTRVLFIAEAVTLAHVARPLVLAQALDPLRYEVFFACHPRFDQLMPDNSFNRHALFTIPSQQFTRALAKGSPLYDVATLRRYVNDDLLLFEETAPDLVVGDFRLSLAVSAPLAGIPYVTISNIYWSPYAQQTYPVPDLPLTRLLGAKIGQILFSAVRPAAFALHTIPLNRVRREYGLPFIGGDLRRVYTWADHTLYADVPGLVRTAELPPNHHFLGPILWSPETPHPTWWDNIPRDKPIIYATLGSSGRADLLPRIIEALAGLPVTALVSTLGRITLEQVPDNIYLADYLPGEAAASISRLVICNGGSPTTQQALMHGVPVLGIPSNLDQHLNMNGLTRYRAGLSIRAEQADAGVIRNTVAHMLKTEQFHQRAGELAEIFADYRSQARFTSLVDKLI